MSSVIQNLQTNSHCVFHSVKSRIVVPHDRYTNPWNCFEFRAKSLVTKFPSCTVCCVVPSCKVCFFSDFSGSVERKWSLGIESNDLSGDVVICWTVVKGHFKRFMFLWPCIVSKAWRKNTNKMQQYKWFIVNSRCWLLTTVSTRFGHLYAHHQEKRPRVTAYGFFAGSVGCGWLWYCGATL